MIGVLALFGIPAWGLASVGQTRGEKIVFATAAVLLVLGWLAFVFLLAR